MHQTAIHTGTTPYHPNSIDGDEPHPADEKHGGYVQTPRAIEGDAVRVQPASFDDHFSQATMFYRSLSPIEQTHVVEAFTFELGKVYEKTIKEREIQVLANVDTDLCEQVATGLGLLRPERQTRRERHRLARAGADLGRARSDRRTQDRDHRRCGLRPCRRFQVGESYSSTWCYRIGDRAGRWGSEGRPPHRHRRPNAGHCAVDRVRRARRGRRHHTDRRHQTRRAAPRSVPPLQGDRRMGRRRRRTEVLRASPAEIRAWRWPRKSDHPAPVALASLRHRCGRGDLPAAGCRGLLADGRGLAIFWRAWLAPKM